MHVGARALIVTGALVLTALTPRLLQTPASSEPERAALSAATSESPAAASAEVPADTDPPLPGQFRPHLFAQAAPRPDSGAARPSRQIKGDRGACSSGVVVLTFDDGPDRDVTPGLIETLTDLDVPATFFMVGNRVAAQPQLARRGQEAGFTIANHSFSHELMTRQSDAAIRHTLRRTHRQLKAAGLTPSPLMRPPYGGIDGRVERAIRDVGLVPVLWDVDSRDWERRSPRQIADKVLAGLRAGASNVVLQHDGVGNSPNSARAVPRIVRQARKRGYCFGDLDDRGRAVLPTPRLTATAAPTLEGDRIRLRLRLNAASSRRTSVRVRTVDGTAIAGTDYRPRSTRVVFPAGSTRATVSVRTMGDGVYGRGRDLLFRLSAPRRIELGTEEVPARIRNAEPAPRVRLIGSKVRLEAGAAPRGELTVKLSEISARPVRIRIRQMPGSPVKARRWVVVPPGTRSVTVGVRLRGVDAAQRQRVRVRIVSAKHARPAGDPAKLVVLPPA